MKNKIILPLIAISLVSCSNTSPNDIKIICPSGAPALAFYDYSDSDSFVTGAAQNIVSQMNKSSTYNVVVIDTLSGIKAIENGAPYKLASTLTFGNFYIAGTGNDEDETIDEDDNIVIFSQGMTPDIVFHYIYKDKYDNNITYVDNVNTAKAVLETGKNLDGTLIDYVFIAEPALTGAKKVAKDNSREVKTIINIQDEYMKVSNGKRLIQASLFIKNDLAKDTADKFLNKLEQDIKEILLTPDTIVSGMEKIDNPTQKFGVTPALAKATLMNNNSIGLDFKKSIDIKEDIDTFMSLLGKDITDETIYF